MTEIYLHFLFAHYGLYGHAPVVSLWVLTRRRCCCIIIAGMHEDRPGHTPTFTGMEDFVANQLGSLFTSDEPNSWIGISLKKSRMIIPTHYTLGYHEIGNDLFAPRSWELQGSSDGADIIGHARNNM